MNPQTSIKAAWALWGAIWIALNFAPNRNGEIRPSQKEQVAQGFAVIGLGLLLADFGPTFFRVPERLRPALVWIVCGGLAFSVWARVSLGSQWASMSADRTVDIDTGPYAFTTHPIYLGTGVAALATAPALGNASAGAGAAILMLALVAKAMCEEDTRT